MLKEHFQQSTSLKALKGGARPETSLDTAQDSKVFENYVQADLEIEVSRAVKFRELCNIYEEEAERITQGIKEEHGRDVVMPPVNKWLLENLFFLENCDPKYEALNEEHIYN